MIYLEGWQEERLPDKWRDILTELNGLLARSFPGSGPWDGSMELCKTITTDRSVSGWSG